MRFRPIGAAEFAHTSGNASLAGAMILAMRFIKRTPTWREIRDEFNVSRATAYRWLRAIKDVKGEA